MLDNPVARRQAAREIAEDAMRGEDGDPFGELNDLDRKFFRNAHVRLLIPIVDPVVAKRCLRMLRDESERLLAELDRTSSRRSQSLLIHRVVNQWSLAFQRWGKK